jgi:hypothetical protein
MSNILLISSIFFIKIWAVGFFGFHISGIIHILPAISIFALFVLFYKKLLLKKTLNTTRLEYL